jgi:hypothetical protein
VRRAKQSGAWSGKMLMEEAAPRVAWAAASMAAMSAAVTRASGAGAGLEAEFLCGVAN